MIVFRSMLVLVLAIVAGLAAVIAPAPPAMQAQSQGQTHATLIQPAAFHLLPLTSIRPRGWLRRQLRIQADGLSGHLDEFWPDVGRQSAWRGGTGEGWERGPYFLDGLVPLAYLLDDPVLIAKARPWIEWTLTHQRPDGGMGPPQNDDWWPNMIMLKVLTQYQEATGDERVVPFMRRYFAYHAAQAARRPLREWAAYRWQDEVLSILWLYERTGDASLLGLAKTLHAQGFDWKAQFADFRYTDKITRADEKLNTHGVNNAMALKTSAVWWRVSGDPDDRAAAARQLELMDRYHLLPNGVHSADEHYGGRNPSQGTELCAVVEGMFSIEHLIAILGDAALGDRLEKIAFNALPGTFDQTMWAHQYDQQPNQVLCSLRPRDWSSNGPESNLFGLEPHFGCCTANFHQGWPKFTASLWMHTPDNAGLVAAAYAPNNVRTHVAGTVPIEIVEDTEYPFRDTITFTVNPARPVQFPLLLRIPGWAANARLTVNDADEPDPRPGTFHRIERTWKPGDRVVLQLPMRVRASRWYHDSVALERGPLVFALPIGESWQPATGLKHPAIAPAKDWEVHPTTPWAYGLVADGAAVNAIEVRERPVGAIPFSTSDAPVTLIAHGRLLEDWHMLNGSAAPPPQSPVQSTAPLQPLTLIPYGAAKLRITAFPVLASPQ